MYRDKNGDCWYRGNIHTHTTVSDGVKTPEETKAVYREMGYDFIALTDHRIFTEGCEHDGSGLLVLSGIEYDYGGDDSASGVFHIVGIGMERAPGVRREDGVQAAIDGINASGGLAVLAHPAWSLNTYDMIMRLGGLFGTEIYNSVSGAPRNCRPYSGAVVDELAVRGHILSLVADDDTHFHIGEQGMSYIMVNLKDKPLNCVNLIEALREGRFIATQGPMFTCERCGDDIVVKSESGFVSAVFFTNRPWEPNRAVYAGGAAINEARFRIHERDTFVRAEITDACGRVGFAQIIKV